MLFAILSTLTVHENLLISNAILKACQWYDAGGVMTGAITRDQKKNA
jgi:hypothetical protein